MENNQENEITDFLDMSEFSGMKKKKKKVKFNLDEKDCIKQTNMDAPLSLKNGDEMIDTETDLSFNLPKKKKKKKVNIQDLSSMPDDDEAENEMLGTVTEVSIDNAAADYEYEDLLALIYGMMRQKDPNRDLEGKKRLVMKPPQVIRVGTKKSSFVNFLDICKMLHRNPQHLQSFLLVELGTSGSIDGNNQLIIKGRFEQRQIESVLRHYIKEYVTCHTCRSPDTYLQKDIRLFFLQCESCGSRCSVASIKSGFQALTSKRAAMRAKES